LLFRASHHSRQSPFLHERELPGTLVGVLWVFDGGVGPWRGVPDTLITKIIIELEVGVEEGGAIVCAFGNKTLNDSSIRNTLVSTLARPCARMENYSSQSVM